MVNALLCDNCCISITIRRYLLEENVDTAVDIRIHNYKDVRAALVKLGAESPNSGVFVPGGVYSRVFFEVTTCIIMSIFINHIYLLSYLIYIIMFVFSFIISIIISFILFSFVDPSYRHR